MALTGIFVMATAAGIFLSERLDLFSLKDKYLSGYFSGGGYPNEIVFLLSLLLVAAYAIFLRSAGNRSSLSRLLLALVFLGGVLQGTPLLTRFCRPTMNTRSTGIHHFFC